MTPHNHLTKHPRHAEVQGEIDSLNSALAKVETRIGEIDAHLFSHQPEADRHASLVDAAMSFADTGVVVNSVQSAATLQSERLALCAQRDALKTVIAQRRADAQGLTGELSREHCAKLIGQHKAIARRMLEALYALDAAQEEERALHRAITAAGYDVHFTECVQWPHVGMLAQRSESALWHRVRELEAYAK